MTHHRLMLPLLFAAAVLCAAVAQAQPSIDPPEVIVSLHRIAPGKQLDFLKWLAANEAIAKEAGVPAGQLYAHTNGDSWDYMVINPVLTDAQDAKVEEVTKKHGRPTGFAASLEFRSMIAWHTDTFAIGPTTATEVLAGAGK
jgi:hypothetical protein